MIPCARKLVFELWTRLPQLITPRWICNPWNEHINIE